MTGAVRAARVSRADFAGAREIWLAHGVTLAFLSIATAALAVAIPAYNAAVVLAFACWLGLIASVILVTPSPAEGTLRAHASLASVYASIGLGEWSLQPDWQVPLGATMFVATLTAVRVRETPLAVGHLIAASACLVVPAVAVGATGHEIVGLAVLLLTMWTLTWCVTLLVAAAEEQGDQLQLLLRVDPQTGVGNQLLLTERTAAEIAAHARRRQPLSIVAMDLEDFTGLNDRLGRATCDDLLRSVAGVIRASVPIDATIARIADDEFWLLLPASDRIAADVTVQAIRGGLAGISTGDAEQPVLSAASGIAVYPSDAVHPPVLLDMAHQQLADDQQLAHPPAHSALPPRTEREVPAAPPAVVRGLSRRDLADHGLVRTYMRAASWVGVALMTVVVITSEVSVVRASPLLAVLAVNVVASVLACSRPIDSRWNDVLLGSIYGCAAAAFWTFAPDISAASAVAALVAPTVAVRLVERRRVYAHLVGASLSFIAAGSAIALVDINLARQPTLALVALLPSLWSLGVSCMFGLELAEQQGRDLEEAVRRDYVTGTGNRLRLDEALGHADAFPPFALTAVEIIETFENSRGTSEALLRAAADAIQAVCEPPDVLTRRRGHEFVLLLPGASRERADSVATAIVGSLARLRDDGHRIECRLATVASPERETTTELLELLDRRLANSGPPYTFRAEPR